MNAAAAGASLMVVTGHGQIDPQHPTGLWLEEFATPCRIFTQQRRYGS